MMQPRPHSPLESLRTALLAALAASILAACGGGGGGGSNGAGTVGTPPTGGGPVSTVSTGVMTKGSTIVNGVRFEDTTANISIDDTPKTAAALQNGMVVKVVGTVNDDGINGTAQRVKALVEVRGAPVSPNVTLQSFVVNGQTVLVDDQTIFSNLAGFNAIAAAPLIEVHGLRDATGNIRATRIEANQAQMGDNTLDEIRGVVANGSGARPVTFTLGGQAINVVATAVIVPTGANWPNGTVVEVFCSARPCVVSGVFQASRLKVEDAQDDAFRPANGQRMEAEGLISGFTQHPGDFSVAGTPVTTTSSTRFEGGIATDLANNVKVEAEGTWNGTRLVANKIEFKRSVVRLQGTVTAVNTGLNQFTLNVAGHSVTIVRDSLTNGALPPVSTTNCVQVRGQRQAPAMPVVVTAGEIRVNNCSNSGRPVMQAPVEAENGTTLTLLGFPIDVANPTDNPPFEDLNGAPMTRDAFLNAVTPAGTNAAGVSVAGTLVKVSFNEGTTTVHQVELED
jgi:hypothetical protein